MEINVKKQVADLNHNIQEFIRCIDLLPELLFLKKMDEWAPRDVTAHLIGWNLYTIEGCQQLKKRETPFYLVDPGNDFCKVNALLVKKYDSKDKKKLINRLKASAKELKKYIATIHPADWENDFGVTYKGEAITIKNSIDALISEFITHKQQIIKWSETASNSNLRRGV